jgi:hypothetical protein
MTGVNPYRPPDPVRYSYPEPSVEESSGRPPQFIRALVSLHALVVVASGWVFFLPGRHSTSGFGATSLVNVLVWVSVVFVLCAPCVIFTSAALSSSDGRKLVRLVFAEFVIETVHIFMILTTGFLFVQQ